MTHQTLIASLSAALGENLSRLKLASVLDRVRILEPDVGEQFWRADTAAPGILVVLSGKVRLLDSDDNLALTLSAGSAFGELTLFLDHGFQVYSARASHQLRVAILSLDCIHLIIESYPDLQARLNRQAVLRNMFFLCRQIPAFKTLPRPTLFTVISLLDPYLIRADEPVPEALLNQSLWILHRGELVNAEEQRLLPGQLYFPTQLPTGGWRASLSTELFVLSPGDIETLAIYAPELGKQLHLLVATRTVSAPLAQPIDSAEVVSVPSKSIVKRQVRSQKIVPIRSKKRSPQVAQAFFPYPSVRVGQWWQHLVGRYPFMRQQSVMDCGVACLVMIGRYWGKRFSVQHLRTAANVDRSGVTLRGLINSAESIGFATRPVKATLPGLTAQTLPTIAHWQGNHYVVVYKISRKHVILGDPEVGIRSLTPQEFLEGWNGYALLLEPTANFYHVPEANNNPWKFWELVKPHWRVLLEIFLASLLIQLFGLVTPLLTQVLLDRVIVQRSATSLAAIGSGLILFTLFPMLMRSLRRYLLYHTANRIDLSLAVGFIGHTFRLPLNYFDTRFVGDITSRIQENKTIRAFLSGDAITTVLDLIMVFVYVTLMFWYNAQLAQLALISIPLISLITLATTPIVQRISREIFNAKATERSYLIEALNGMGTVKAMGVERTVRWRWEDLFGRYIKTKFSGKILNEQIKLASGLVEGVVNQGLFLFGIWLVIHEQLTIGQLIAFNMLLGNVISPFRRLISLWHDFQEVLIAMERINDVINTPPEEDSQRVVLPSLPRVRGQIRFENVTFRYNPEADTNVLTNLNFEVQPGQVVALVGRSGSGKTTLSKLLLGLYAPTEGNIYIDGCNINSVLKQSLRQQIGVVDQNTFLFGGTIRANIALAQPQAPLEKVIEAARLAGADRFIEALPLQYETEIGEGGGLLSGGQRQRVAIARALLADPRLLIFDEATSNLDTESERIIQNNLAEMTEGRTTLIIAHRLSTVQNADLILVLDQGVVIEHGTHAELMDRRGIYFYLNQQQLTAA